jgi:hypothetical protein
MLRRIAGLVFLVGSMLVLPLAQSALAAPRLTDFNGDGFADLAVGVPFEDVGAISNAGAVNVLYGSSAGLTSAGDQFWTQDATGTDPSEAGDNFGSFVATGDFDGDGFTDLAIGVPFEDVGAVTSAGAVNVLYGSSVGLTDDGAQFWTQDSTGIQDLAEAFDNFGTSLAAGDFNGDARSDLAVGVPLEDVEALSDAGGVNVLYGSSAGLSTTDQFWTQDSSGIADTAEAFDEFGWSVASANFGKSSQADLAIGVPFEDVGATGGAGGVNVLYGTSTALTATEDQFWTQDSSGVLGTAEVGDLFGFSLAAANLGKGSQADLAVGVPFEAVGAVDSAGGVNVLYGSTTGLTATGDQFWTQDSSGVLDTAEAGDNFGFSLAAANFGKSSQADLAVGVLSEDVGAIDGAGGVNVLYGSSTGLTATGDQFWTQDSSGVLDTAEAFDDFGFSLAPRGSGISPD